MVLKPQVFWQDDCIIVTQQQEFQHNAISIKSKAVCMHIHTFYTLTFAVDILLCNSFHYYCLLLCYFISISISIYEQVDSYHCVKGRMQACVAKAH